MFDTVFISYATEDIEYAKKLYDFLKENNFKPWLDKINLLPGQQWDYEIRKALREANYVILLLSSNSVEKRGYVQREFKTALEYYEEKLDDDIYLIPVKIDQCTPPQRLSSFQWIVLENDDSFNKIINSLHLQQNRYLEHQQKQLNEKLTFETKIVDENHLYKNRSNVNFSINCRTIQFTDQSNQSLKELNQYIEGKKAENLLSFRSWFIQLNNSLFEEETMDWYFDFNIGINHINTKILSLIENTYTFTGGAHGNTAIFGLNFALNPNFKLDVEKLFEYQDHDIVLNFMSDYCFASLRDNYNEELEIDTEEIRHQSKNTLFWEGSLDPKWDNFNNFIINKESLSIIFNQYQVSSYSFGIHFVEIPYEEFLKLPIDISILKILIEKLR